MDTLELTEMSVEQTEKTRKEKLLEKGVTNPLLLAAFETLDIELSDRVVVLRAVYGKTAGAIVAVPVRDKKIKGRFIGIPVLSEFESSNFPYDLNPEHRIVDNTRFDLSDPYQAYTWNWVKSAKYLAKSIEEADKNPETLYYIEDQEAILDSSLKKFEYKSDAFAALKDLTLGQKQDILRLLKINAKHYKEKEVFQLVLEETDKDPKKILDIIATLGTEKGKITVMIKKLVEIGTIVKYGEDGYKYGNEILGLSMHEAIQFFKDRKNATLVKSFMDKIGESVKELETDIE